MRTLIIDERSLMGREFLSWIDKRLREIKGQDLPFGGCNVLIFGDDNQLATINDTALYYNHAEKGKTESNCGVELYKLFDTKIILKHNFRQATTEVGTDQ